MSNWVWYGVILVMLLSACTGDSTPQGPRLIQEVTVAATNAVSTRSLSPTITQERIVTPERLSPLNNVTVDASFVIVTPTLPPSKTPTPTQTQSPTPTLTATATMTNTATATSFLLPTSEILSVTDAVAAPNDQICDSNWFFIEPDPGSCPVYPPNASPGVYQEFQNGVMIWVGSQDAIYVMFNDSSVPRWQVFRDFFNNGMIEESPAYLTPPTATLWQPRRGFGLLWRDNQVLRNRLGWATQQWEEPYSVQVQTADNASIFLGTPSTNVIVLFPNGQNWNRYATTTDSLPTIGGEAIPPSVPLPTVPFPTALPPQSGL
ncbi:MAG: hypothetical protein Q9P44_10435 [Anaerolineae bacterium]|nr:hypothetical protein [Anaerolineae bacterium]